MEEYDSFLDFPLHVLFLDVSDKQGDFWIFTKYFIQQCFICRP
jgi:hypothetical protein